uniref:Uncharacterized protein n=1 Tax=Chromera velia CCMP2878 TaxID=1169474 RepID=A0A0G4HYT8_9ALVE|eukprot:Cvel_9561.t1-p1 / transcript=Cvel_9561.t1 / gene=Cvel_9561 / organism=Chromera_velia_CCMP2878 / gene_product=hypothetical protein / transcript_product=hypothetical protein / location=Cvel_scaffold554:5395-16321(+) / protein_length=1704 / sequence_SO=supercontig / SO=protein_coding / is_pseudo=false
MDEGSVCRDLYGRFVKARVEGLKELPPRIREARRIVFEKDTEGAFQFAQQGKTANTNTSLQSCPACEKPFAFGKSLSLKLAAKLSPKHFLRRNVCEVCLGTFCQNCRRQTVALVGDSALKELEGGDGEGEVDEENGAAGDSGDEGGGEKDKDKHETKGGAWKGLGGGGKGKEKEVPMMRCCRSCVDRIRSFQESRLGEAAMPLSSRQLKKLTLKAAQNYTSLWSLVAQLEGLVRFAEERQGGALGLPEDIRSVLPILNDRIRSEVSGFHVLIGEAKELKVRPWPHRDSDMKMALVNYTLQALHSAKPVVVTAQQRLRALEEKSERAQAVVSMGGPGAGVGGPNWSPLQSPREPPDSPRSSAPLEPLARENPGASPVSPFVAPSEEEGDFDGGGGVDGLDLQSFLEGAEAGSVAQSETQGGRGEGEHLGVVSTSAGGHSSFVHGQRPPSAPPSIHPHQRMPSLSVEGDTNEEGDAWGHAASVGSRPSINNYPQDNAASFGSSPAEHLRRDSPPFATTGGERESSARGSVSAGADAALPSEAQKTDEDRPGGLRGLFWAASRRYQNLRLQQQQEQEKSGRHLEPPTGGRGSASERRRSSSKQGDGSRWSQPRTSISSRTAAPRFSPFTASALAVSAAATRGYQASASARRASRAASSVASSPRGSDFGVGVGGTSRIQGERGEEETEVVMWTESVSGREEGLRFDGSAAAAVEARGGAGVHLAPRVISGPLVFEDEEFGHTGPGAGAERRSLDEWGGGDVHGANEFSDDMPWLREGGGVLTSSPEGEDKESRLKKRGASIPKLVIPPSSVVAEGGGRGSARSAASVSSPSLPAAQKRESDAGASPVYPPPPSAHSAPVHVNRPGQSQTTPTQQPPPLFDSAGVSFEGSVEAGGDDGESRPPLVSSLGRPRSVSFRGRPAVSPLISPRDPNPSPPVSLPGDPSSKVVQADHWSSRRTSSVVSARAGVRAVFSRLQDEEATALEGGLTDSGGGEAVEREREKVFTFGMPAPSSPPRTTLRSAVQRSKSVTTAIQLFGAAGQKGRDGPFPGRREQAATATAAAMRAGEGEERLGGPLWRRRRTTNVGLVPQQQQQPAAETASGGRPDSAPPPARRPSSAIAAASHQSGSPFSGPSDHVNVHSYSVHSAAGSCASFSGRRGTNPFAPPDEEKEEEEKRGEPRGERRSSREKEKRTPSGRTVEAQVEGENGGGVDTIFSSMDLEAFLDLAGGGPPLSRLQPPTLLATVPEGTASSVTPSSRVQSGALPLLPGDAPGEETVESPSPFSRGGSRAPSRTVDLNPFANSEEGQVAGGLEKEKRVRTAEREAEFERDVREEEEEGKSDVVFRRRTTTSNVLGQALFASCWMRTDKQGKGGSKQRQSVNFFNGRENRHDTPSRAVTISDLLGGPRKESPSAWGDGDERPRRRSKSSGSAPSSLSASSSSSASSYSRRSTHQGHGQEEKGDGDHSPSAVPSREGSGGERRKSSRSAQQVQVVEDSTRPTGRRGEKEKRGSSSSSRSVGGSGGRSGGGSQRGMKLLNMALAPFLRRRTVHGEREWGETESGSRSEGGERGVRRGGQGGRLSAGVPIALGPGWKLRDGVVVMEGGDDSDSSEPDGKVTLLEGGRGDIWEHTEDPDDHAGLLEGGQASAAEAKGEGSEGVLRGGGRGRNPGVLHAKRVSVCLNVAAEEDYAAAPPRSAMNTSTRRQGSDS